MLERFLQDLCELIEGDEERLFCFRKLCRKVELYKVGFYRLSRVCCSLGIIIGRKGYGSEHDNTILVTKMQVLMQDQTLLYVIM